MKGAKGRGVTKRNGGTGAKGSGGKDFQMELEDPSKDRKHRPVQGMKMLVRTKKEDVP